MSSTNAEHQFANATPARRGEVIALSIDTVARPYNIADLALAGFAPSAGRKTEGVFVTLQALTADVWYYFAAATAADLDPAAVLAAGSALAYATTHGDRIAAGTSLRVRIDRQRDRYLIVRTATGTATLLIRASSESI